MSTIKNECCEKCRDREDQTGATTCNFKHPEDGAIGICPCHTTTDQKQQIHNTPLKDQATTEKKCECACHFITNQRSSHCCPTTDTRNDIDKGLAALYRVQELIAEKQGGDTSDPYLEPYYVTDHSHCPQTNSPCGLEGKHRCCLCGQTKKTPI